MRYFLCFAVLLVCADVQANELTKAEADLALALAQVCANEASLAAPTPGDCALIWQAARKHGRTPEARLRWLRRHSSCVLSDRPMRGREKFSNCRWSRHLTAEDAEPEGWDPQTPWERYAGRWRRMRRYAAYLVRGGRPRAGWPCRRDPDTWGGPMDHRRALNHGMVPLSCQGTRNEGYLYPSPLARAEGTIYDRSMDRTVIALDGIYQRLLEALEEGRGDVTLAQCVPLLVGVIEERVPETATIMRPEDIREMCTQVVLEVLERQLQAA